MVEIGLKQLEEIRENVKIELIKRGFIGAANTLSNIIAGERKGYSFIKMESESFNTVPVIFKDIKVCIFNSNIKEKENNVIGVWFEVHVTYNHFDGGSNGTKLFSFSCDIDSKNNIRSVYNTRIS